MLGRKQDISHVEGILKEVLTFIRPLVRLPIEILDVHSLIDASYRLCTHPIDTSHGGCHFACCGHSRDRRWMLSSS
jgi:hypothetical protein